MFCVSLPFLSCVCACLCACVGCVLHTPVIPAFEKLRKKIGHEFEANKGYNPQTLSHFNA